jgi:hypothetical protein
MGDALWDAWACLCSSGTHLKVCCVLSNPIVAYYPHIVVSFRSRPVGAIRHLMIFNIKTSLTSVNLFSKRLLPFIVAVDFLGMGDDN